MTVPTKLQPNYTTQTAAAYKAALDGITAIHDRIAGAFAAHEMDVGSPAPDLAVRVDAGYIFDGMSVTEIAAQTVSGFTTPSAGQTRVDRIVVDGATGVASRVAGTAVTGSPSATPPSIPAGYLPNSKITITSANATITNSMIVDERVLPNSCIALAVKQTTTSGTSKDFTGIPASAKRIDISFVSNSTNGTDDVLIQLGTSGGLATTGYLGASSALVEGAAVGTTNYTTGFGIRSGATAAVRHGVVSLILHDAATFTWAVAGVLARSDAAISMTVAGSKALSAVLTQLRVTTLSGTDAFDLGSVNITVYT